MQFFTDEENNNTERLLPGWDDEPVGLDESWAEERNEGLQDATINEQERRRAESRRDRIAKDMWNAYVEECIHIQVWFEQA